MARLDIGPQRVLYEWIEAQWPGQAACNLKGLFPGRKLEVDIAFLGEKIAIEVDGYRYHIGKRKFDDDRYKQSELVSQGWLFLRFTTGQVYREIRWCLDIIQKCLDQRLAATCKDHHG